MTVPEPGTTPGPGSGPTLIDGVDVDALAAAVRGCAAVDDLYSSPGAAVASYLPGRQVAGIRIAADTVTVQVRSRWSIPVMNVAEQVRGASRPLVGKRKIDVAIADIADPPQTAPAALPAAPADAAPVQVTQPGSTAPALPAGPIDHAPAAAAGVDVLLPFADPDPAGDTDPIPPGISEVPWPPISDPSGPPDASSSEPITPTGAEIAPLS